MRIVVARGYKWFSDYMAAANVVVVVAIVVTSVGEAMYFLVFNASLQAPWDCCIGLGSRWHVCGCGLHLGPLSIILEGWAIRNSLNMAPIMREVSALQRFVHKTQPTLGKLNRIPRMVEMLIQSYLASDISGCGAVGTKGMVNESRNWGRRWLQGEEYQPKVTTIEFVLARVGTSKLTHSPCLPRGYKYKATVYAVTSRLMLVANPLLTLVTPKCKVLRILHTLCSSTCSMSRGYTNKPNVLSITQYFTHWFIILRFTISPWWIFQPLHPCRVYHRLQ